MKPEDDAARMGIRLSPTAAPLLAALTALLVERAVPLGIVGRSDAPRMYERHVLDSLRAAAAFGPNDRVAYDLGSGAGLPGLVLAIALPRVRFVLAESRSKRAGFLEYAVERLGLENVEVFLGRAETLAPGADVVTARAFAPLPRAWTVAAPLLAPGGRLVYFAGRRAEVDRAGEGAKAEVSLLEVLESSPPLVIMSPT